VRINYFSATPPLLLAGALLLLYDGWRMSASTVHPHQLTPEPARHVLMLVSACHALVKVSYASTLSK
jgi:hypothetical protein